MSLKMSKQAIIELLNSNAVKYRKAYSRKAKGELLIILHKEADAGTCHV